MNQNKEYYIYILQDPNKKVMGPDKYGLKNRPFYVGKGKGSRSRMHEYNVEKYGTSHNSSLLAKLMKLKSMGKSPIVTKVYFTDDEDIAYEKETEIINHYGLKYKDGLLLNAGSGKAGGWGGQRNPTFDRMQFGNHNFQTSNPQVSSPKVRKLTKMIKEVNGTTDIVKSQWVTKSGYVSIKALKTGINRIISRDKLSYKLDNNNLVKI